MIAEQPPGPILYEMQAIYYSERAVLTPLLRSVKIGYKNLLKDTLTSLLDSHDRTTTAEHYARMKARFERGLTS